MSVLELHRWAAAGAMAGAVLLVTLSAGAGLWWVALPVGACLGLFLRGALSAVAPLLAGLLGWGLPLARQAAAGAPVGRTGEVIGGILGAPGPLRALVAVAFTILLGVLLCMSGAWAGASFRRIFTGWAR